MTTSDNRQQLIAKLKELFQMDQADLDFGIYRIMNAKRDEITRFLEKDLMPTLRGTLEKFQPAGQAEKQMALEEAIKAAHTAGFDPEQSPKVQQLRAELSQSVDLEREEETIYSDLTNFFSRYYQSGDFMSLRRYKEGVYALPYEGEEVKLHWANADQYYIKTAESFTHYAFKTAQGRVRFELIAASTERDNVKASPENERRFILAEHPLAEKNGELVVFFEFRPDQDKRKQKELNTQVVNSLLTLPAEAPQTQSIQQWSAWQQALASIADPEQNKSRSLLEKHLSDYTAKNTFDYFIHKDLGKFLRRELDFFIKNEVMHLDDIEDETTLKVEQYLARIKAMRQIAHKIIAFLAQLEDFQKKLWLKKKFILETQWMVTLERIDESFYPEICEQAEKPQPGWDGKTRSQREEWLELYKIDQSENGAYSEPLSPEFLKANPSLVLDTRYFSQELTDRLLDAIAENSSLDEQTDALLVHGENFQVLRLLEERYREQIRCIAIDPPYNRLGDGFPYKDNYRHSSWLTMMRDRLGVAASFLRQDGALFSNIDENERDSLQALLDLTFGKENRVEELIWAQNTTHSQSPLYSTNHEYVEVYARDRQSAEQDPKMFREPKPGYVEISDLIKKLNPSYPSTEEIEKEIATLYKKHVDEFKDELKDMGLKYNEETKKQDPWRGIYNYNKAEYRDSEGKLVDEPAASKQNARIVIWREDNPSAPAQKQADSTRDPNSANYRFYKPMHPITGRSCPHPKTGWRWPYKWDDSKRDCFSALDADGRIVWGETEEKIPQYKRFLHEVETNVSKSYFHDYTDGEKQLAALFGETGVFPTPKPTTLPSRFISQVAQKTDYIMDFFGGSGTTGHAVINLNREDNGTRKFVLVEAGEHFDQVLIKRVKKVVYAPVWDNGQPVIRPASPQSRGNPSLIKLLRVESYEDTLSNLGDPTQTIAQQNLLKGKPAFRESYLLNYMLSLEFLAPLMSLDHFADPFNVRMSLTRNDEARIVTVDLVETFNYLLGLRVHSTRKLKGVREVIGKTPSGDRTLILWRNTEETDNETLDEWFRKQAYNSRDREFDLIYVNGDNNLENLRRPDESWKVRLIEEAFQTLMFDVEDV